ncbi:MAG: S41 family peptidase, partial [Nitrospinota bacterium]
MNSQDSFSSKNQYRLHKYFITFFIALAIGVAIGFSSSSSQADDRDYKYLEIFTEALTLIKKKYVKEVETEHLMDGAIDGMLRSLDPHSSYLTPKMFTQMQSDTSGKFGGLGIEITLSDGWLTVITPFEGTPAWEAGIETGDKILRIDDEATYDMGLMDAVWKMRGKKGTSVKITIFREGLNEPKELNIVRDTITV